MKLEITKATVVRGTGPDHVFLDTELPEAVWPYTGKLTLTFHAAYGSGVEYVKQMFHMNAELIDHG